MSTEQNPAQAEAATQQQEPKKDGISRTKLNTLTARAAQADEFERQLEELRKKNVASQGAPPVQRWTAGPGRERAVAAQAELDHQKINQMGDLMNALQRSGMESSKAAMLIVAKLKFEHQQIDNVPTGKFAGKIPWNLLIGGIATIVIGGEVVSNQGLRSGIGNWANSGTGFLEILALVGGAVAFAIYYRGKQK